MSPLPLYRVVFLSLPETRTPAASLLSSHTNILARRSAVQGHADPLASKTGTDGARAEAVKDTQANRYSVRLNSNVNDIVALQASSNLGERNQDGHTAFSCFTCNAHPRFWFATARQRRLRGSIALTN